MTTQSNNANTPGNVTAPKVNAINPQSSSSTTAGGKNLLETAKANGGFKTFLKAVNTAGMENVLNGSESFTVFAPTDTAFDRMPAGRLDTLLKPENKTELRAVLNYHVISGRKSAADLGKLTSAKTVEGHAAPIQQAGKGFSIDGARVVTWDIAASNGMLHAIDKVNMPAVTKQ